MSTTMPPLGWEGTLGVFITMALLVGVIVIYHRWLDRRLGLHARRPALDPACRPAVEAGWRGVSTPGAPGSTTGGRST